MLTMNWVYESIIKKSESAKECATTHVAPAPTLLGITTNPTQSIMSVQPYTKYNVWLYANYWL